MNPELNERIQAIASDHHSGAAELSRQARQVLTLSFSLNCTLEAAAALCRAQPAMAPIWNAAISAISERENRERWNLLSARWDRAGGALGRVASGALSHQSPALHVVTHSMSAAVLDVLRRLKPDHAIRVSCSEGRPTLEGRQLAATLATDGIDVDLFTDAAIGSALDDADFLVIGADAVGSAAWINKTGTRMLAASAHVRGVPIHVLATSDKLVMPPLWPHLTRREAAPSEVWDSAPPGVRVRNPYFETIPLDLATTVITDIGVLGCDLVPEACAALDTPASRRALDELRIALGHD